jgi:hypothetical protein
MAEMGLSNLGALQRTHAEIVAIKAYEEREQKAQATMTIADYTKMDAVRSKITPPSNYNEIQANIGTTLGLVAITCGPRSGVFKKLLELHQVLQGGYVQAIQKIAYSPRRCREYSWAVYKAMREYFSVELTPEKCGPETQFVNYPLLLINDIIAKARNGEGVFRATYPAAWQVMDKKDSFDSNEPAGHTSQ